MKGIPPHALCSRLWSLEAGESWPLTQINKISDAQWPWETRASFFGWLSLKGNLSHKKRKKGATGQLGNTPVASRAVSNAGGVWSFLMLWALLNMIVGLEKKAPKDWNVSPKSWPGSACVREYRTAVVPVCAHAQIPQVHHSFSKIVFGIMIVEVMVISSLVRQILSLGCFLLPCETFNF